MEGAWHVYRWMHGLIGRRWSVPFCRVQSQAGQSLLSFDDRRLHVPLVCKRFAEVTAGPIPIWDTLDITIALGDSDSLRRSSLWRWLEKRGVTAEEGHVAAAKDHRLRVLANSCNFLQQSGIQAVQHSLPHLREFSLQLLAARNDSRITAAHLDLLGQLQSLQQLRVSFQDPDEPEEEWEPSFPWEGQFPVGLCSLTKLQLLEIIGTGNGSMVDLPASISQLMSLETLTLRFCGLSSLAVHSMALLPNLHTLCLEEFELHTLVGNIAQLTNLRLLDPRVFTLPSTLEDLNLSLGAPTPDIAKWKKLLPCVVSLPNLRTLHLHENNLRTLPNGPYLSSLTALYATGGGFRRIPAALRQAIQLQELDLSENSELQLSPSDVSLLAKMPQLDHLDLTKSGMEEPWTDSSLRCLATLEGIFADQYREFHWDPC
ncbi:hypothetical protein WJX72_002348 [[Myrmecia] bisecta]|uniref:Disease resistance R13L4/SHOC-2-like LRR domain-containing protein n=1 Tax=[Myrmecia] bisecta TaxID=41462 RepID=A0AAW1Q0F9_9CHLO